ncbi:helix-turn-helix domain-containing protein [Methylobacterium sp. NEAU 140]|uniref:helix-turn-helix domain-containing protein n=1 Tax=Methylobacterium sp. NEAU 140 TaxID=3064945 RepID=UPI00273515A5|nr:helix-turn-helix domain-containing protein [Methylobacterium sp. NEAU 140]MDP4021874.1 helix-turn-helix domain-containing protein [Methylobacterium sp. NEAU 140]
MARISLKEALERPSTVDREKLAATTEADIARYMREDGFDPDAEPSGPVLSIPTAGELRARLDLTQEAFAAFLRVPVGTVRNWEQGRTFPDPAARTLLALVAADPAHAARILGRPSARPPEDQSVARRRA